MKRLVRGRTVDEWKMPLRNVRIRINQHDAQLKLDNSDVYWSGKDGGFEATVESGLRFQISINAPEFRSSMPMPDERSASLQGRCFRILEITNKDVSNEILDFKDIILGYPIAKIFGQVFTSEGKPFSRGEIGLSTGNIKNYKMDYRISDPAGKFLLEGLDPSDSFMMSVKLEELPGDKFWTIWTFPPVKANGKPLRLVLEDRYKEVKRIDL